MKKKLLSILGIICIIFSSSCSNNSKLYVVSDFTSFHKEFAENELPILIEPLLCSINLPNNNAKPRTIDQIETLEIKNFILQSSLYANTENYLYTVPIPPDNQEAIPFNNQQVDLIVFEVFGVENWSKKNFIEFDSNTDKYYTEYGVGKSIKLDDIGKLVYSDSGIIKISFMLSSWETKNTEDSDWSDFAPYNITFQMLSTQDRMFFRFVQLEKI